MLETDDVAQAAAAAAGVEDEDEDDDAEDDWDEAVQLEQSRSTLPVHSRLLLPTHHDPVHSSTVVVHRQPALQLVPR